MKRIEKICVFCGARPEVQHQYKELARRFGQLLVEHGKALIYGGSGTAGMMGVLSQAVAEVGGHVTGIFPQKALGHVEQVSEYNTINLIVNSLSERKKIMAQKSDAFVALPGGFGTLDEFSEMLVLKQLNIIKQPLFIINQYDFWGDLLKMLERIGKTNFCSEHHQKLYIVVDSIEAFFQHDLIK